MELEWLTSMQRYLRERIPGAQPRVNAGERPPAAGELTRRDFARVAAAAAVGVPALAGCSVPLAEQQPAAARPAGLPQPYDVADLGPFAPSGAIYFMNGTSGATVRVLSNGEQLSFEWRDENTAIAASAPVVYDQAVGERGMYIPVPPPLEPTAFYPRDTPGQYRRRTTMHLMQVVSMNMRSQDGSSRLLIGLPYVEAYPQLFRDGALFGHEVRNAASYGVVQSLTEFADPRTGRPTVESNGYPARSFFGIYHILETPMGAFFNKTPTQMELQPDRDGKLALTLPPIPFSYRLLNGPIQLFDVRNPRGPAVAEVIEAHHESNAAAARPTQEAWPYRAVGARG